MNRNRYHMLNEEENPMHTTTITPPPSLENLTIEDEPEIMSFEDLQLREELLRGIFAYGFEKPSDIQKKAIVPFLQGKDLIAQSQSGTGKTATYSISLLQSIDINNDNVQGIILCPTRELAQQITEVIQTLGCYMNDVKVLCCIGGIGRYVQREQLNDGSVKVVVGTPGRVLDLLTNNILSSKYIRHLIFDEADVMLNEKGKTDHRCTFQEQIQKILKIISKDAQIAIYSATLPDKVLDIAKHFMTNPVRILMKKEMLTLEGIVQTYIEIGKNVQKNDVIIDLFESYSLSQTIIFCNSRQTAEEIFDLLTSHHLGCLVIHRDLTQQERSSTVNDFKKQKARILVATDVMCRGIDIQQISMVINYDLPLNKENYLHRIGRSGRFGRKGFAINLVETREIPLLKDIENFYKTCIPHLVDQQLEKLHAL